VSTPDRQALVDALRQIAAAAGETVMALYRAGTETRIKADASPVTDADEAAEREIVAALATLAPEIPIIAEEQAAAGSLPERAPDRFWLVDPLDGTKEFISRNGEFTVNIALIEDRRPTLGIVVAPAVGTTYFTGADGHAYKIAGDGPPRRITVARPAADGLTAVVSRSHRSPETDAYLARYRIKAERSAGSSLKFGLVAEGAADIYPRLGRTMEWDTAAGHAVVRAAGGSVRALDGADLAYGKPGFDNPSFVVRGRDD